LPNEEVAGQPFDTNKYILASEALERLCGSDPKTSTTDHDFAGAREELRALFDKRAEALERRERRREAEMAANPEKFRREFEDKIQAAIEKHSKTTPDLSSRDDNLSFTHPGGSDAQSGDGVPHPPFAAPDAPAARSEPPLLIEPPEVCATLAQIPPPAPRRRTLDEINAEPANPPARPVEEWRRWVDENGVRTSPWSGGR
jgi:hypothetical protein